MSPDGAAGDCPADAIFTRLIEGTLSAERVRALEAHADACPRCRRALTELARTLTPPGGGDWLDQRYQLLDPLGAGGMGVVHTAFDTKLRRKVAVKRLRETVAGAGSERRRARALREAQLLAAFSHPNVLTVHDVGGADGELYVVMELVDGWTTSRWLEEARPRPGWRQIVDVYLQAGRGLSAAHQLGIVHRDVKPENILVARNGRGLIGDFGLAGLTDAEEPTEGRAEAAPATAGALTQSGTVMGTPAYMAPEQLAGGASDPTSDQFSFCVSLWESLHGRRPFAGQTASELAAAMREGPPPPGLQGVPRAIDRVLATGLAIDRTKRHRSMDHLLAELGKARDRRQRSWSAIAGVLATALALAFVAAVVGRPTSVAPTAQRPAVPPDQKPAGAAPVEKTPRPPMPMAAVREGAGTTGAAAGLRAPPKPAAPAKSAAAAARLWALAHPETDPQLLLMLADRAHGDRDGVGCLTVLNQIPDGAWPAAFADRAARRRATCEMLRGNCARGRRLLEPLDGTDGARAAVMGNCPAGAMRSIEDRLRAVASQADESRYAGNKPARRQELRQILLAQTAAPEILACFRNPRASRACGQRLIALSRAYQVLAESFLAGGDCREGAQLDVMRSQITFLNLRAEEGDPALRCRAERTFAAYKSCVPAGEDAERRCLTRAHSVTDPRPRRPRRRAPRRRARPTARAGRSRPRA